MGALQLGGVLALQAQRLLLFLRRQLIVAVKLYNSQDFEDDDCATSLHHE